MHAFSLNFNIFQTSGVFEGGFGHASLAGKKNQAMAAGHQKIGKQGVARLEMDQFYNISEVLHCFSLTLSSVYSRYILFGLKSTTGAKFSKSYNRLK